MAYIPPHLRNKDKSTAEPPSQPTEETYTSDDIDSVFGDLISPKGTLNNTISKPGVLNYVLLFPQPAPNYNGKGEIFSRNNLHLLHQPEALIDMDDPVPNITDAVPPPFPDTEITHSIFAVFKGISRTNWQSLGYHRINRVFYLEPGSKELVAMLEEKWGQRGRDREKWNEALGKRWAGFEIEMVEGRGEPMAEVNKVGVKERLEALRREERMKGD